MWQQFLASVGLGQVKSGDIGVIFLLVFVACAMFGFMTDLLFRRHGFGAVGNGLMLLLGFVGAAMIFNAYGRKILSFGEVAFASWANSQNLLIASTTGALSLLLAGVIAKRMLVGDDLR